MADSDGQPGGPRGSLSQIACNDDTQGLQSRVVFNATAGTTYHIMVGSFLDGPGGNLQLTVQEAPPAPQVSLSLDRRGSVNRQGVASVSGSVSCSQPLPVDISGSLTQTFANRVLIRGFGSTFVECQPPNVRWTMSVSGENGRFGAGHAHLDANAFGCNPLECASDQKSADIQLRRG